MFSEHITEIVVSLGMLGWIGRSIVRVVMDADVRKIEARRAVETQQSSTTSSEIEQLKAEIMRLRDTTTEHALSLQHTVERLDRRVDFLEQRGAEANAAANGTGRREIEIPPAPLASTPSVQVRQSTEG